MNTKPTFPFFLLMFFLPLLVNSIALAQGQYLSTADLTKILPDRTFIVTSSEENNRLNSHIYFSRDGRYTTLFPSGRVRTTDKWNIDGKDNLCLRRTFRSGAAEQKEYDKREKYVTSCGKVSLAGPSALILYKENGESMGALRFVGNGNLLDRFAE